MKTLSLPASMLAFAALLIAPFAAADGHASAQEHTSGGGGEGAHAMPEVPAHPLFDQFKALEGRWEGTITQGDGGEAQPAVVTYRLTAGGSALVETIAPGTPMEMVSVYHLDGDDLKMTHYCLANNQPTMIATPGEEDHVVHLEFESITNMADPDAMHMHDATFEFLGDNHHRSTWRGYVGGQPIDAMRAVLDVKRVAEADAASH